MFCPNCGQQMNDNAKFCPKCGASPDEFGEDILIMEEAPKQRVSQPKPQTTRQRTTERRADVDSYSDNDYYAERDENDPMERLRTRTKSTYKNVSREVSRQIQSRSLQNWQALSIGLAGFSVVCLLIALFSGRTAIFAESVGSALMVYLMLKRPKFDTPEMIIPVAISSWNFVRIGFVNLLNGSSLYGETFALIARLATYLLLAVYFLMLIGKIKDINVVSYLMLAAWAVVAAFNIYALIENIKDPDFKGIISYLGRVAFSAAFLVFIYKSPKPRLKRGKISNSQRTMGDLFSIIPSKYANYDFSNEHPYYTLGGALQVIVIGGYVVTGVIGIVGIVYLVTMFKNINLGYYMSNAKVGTVLIYIILLAIYLMIVIFSMYLGYILFTKIRKRDETFIKFYHITFAVWASMGFVLVYHFGSFMNSLGELVGSFILTALGTMYFTKSVRVSTYMCTDDYMRHSMFTRNMEAPAPAEYEDDNRQYNDKYDEYDD